MRLAFYFYRMLSRQLNTRLVSTMTCSGQPMNKPVFYLPQIRVVPIRRPQRSGGLRWPWQEIRTKNLESGARDNQSCLRLRYYAPKNKDEYYSGNMAFQ